MKNFILAAIGLFLTIGIFASCSGKNTEKEREDSIRIADSITAEEAAQAAEQARLDSIKFEEQRLKPSALFGISPVNKKDYYLLDKKQMFSNLNSSGFTKGKTKDTAPSYASEWQYSSSKTDFTNDSPEDSDNVTVIIYNIDKGGVCEDETYVRIKFKDEKNKEAFIEDLLKMNGQTNTDLSDIKNGYLYINNKSPLEIEFYTFEEIPKFKK